MASIFQTDTGYGEGVSLALPTACVGITEQQYRRFSGDTTSPWSATGNSIGVETLVQLAGAEMSDYLATYLCPTRVVEEEHRPAILERDRLSQPFARLYHVHTHRKRILPERGITIKWEDWTRARCTVIETTGCAIVLKALTGKLDLSRCYSSSGVCVSYGSDILKVKLSYWAGFETVPIQIQRALALLARYDAMELIAGVSPIFSDLPWGAPTTQRSDLGMSRSFDSPHRYAANEQGISVFGRGYVGIAAQRMIAPFRVFEVRQI